MHLLFNQFRRGKRLISTARSQGEEEVMRTDQRTDRFLIVWVHRWSWRRPSLCARSDPIACEQTPIKHRLKCIKNSYNSFIISFENYLYQNQWYIHSFRTIIKHFDQLFLVFIIDLIIWMTLENNFLSINNSNDSNTVKQLSLIQT